MSRGITARAAVVSLLIPLAAGLTGIQAAGAAPAPADLARAVDQPVSTDRVAALKSPTSRLAKTDAALAARTDSAMVAVSIKLDYDSMATYAGGVQGLAPTSPDVTGQSLETKTDATARYEKFAADKESTFTKALTKAVPQTKLGRSMRVVYGGIAAQVPANKVAEIAKMDGVVAVQEDKLNQIQTDSSAQFIGANRVYSELGGGARNAGKGVIYGNLDSGVWPEHASFADLGNLNAPPGPARACEFGDNPLTPATDVFRCQKKLIGGAHFTDTYDLIVGDDVFPGTARDSNGHGTHTASTSAGNIVEDPTILGNQVADRMHGIAPGASVMVYKVCGPGGCYSTDSAAAVGQAILDGVDVINFSISGGTDPFTDPVELAFLDAYAAGVFVSASAGNSGPTASTVNHLSPWVTTVAASTQTREFSTTLTVTAGNGDTYVMDGATITDGVSGPLVMASDAPYSRPLCDAPAPAGSFAGKIVACQRGGNARVDKGFNVLQGGAIGMVLYNPTLQDVNTDTHYLPTVHLASGTDFVAFMASHTGETASWAAGQAADGQGDVMAAFSSRGPAGAVIKPDVTAPGVQILAGDTPIQESSDSGPPGEYFQAIAGTSMSSPHTAGAAALLMALHTDWTPGQVKSALMTTAKKDVVKEDLTTPADPFDYGSGRIDLRRAGAPGLTFDETAANMASLGADAETAVHLNLPSVNAPVMPGRLTTVRTAKNVSGLRMTYDAQVTAPAGAKITVLPKRFTLDVNQTIELTITIESTAPEQQYFGEVRLKPTRSGYPTLHLPVAFVTGQADVALTSSCSPARIPQGGETICTITANNSTYNDTTVDLKTTVDNKMRVTGATGAQIVDNRTVVKPNVALAGAAPGVPSIGQDNAHFGYLPLDGFGITPSPIDDEEIINYNVPAFQYNGVTYTRLGVDSNGYLIVGGGTSEDNQCCTLPDGPSPARPNNVLAPFWTDLDGTGTDGIYAGTLSLPTGERWLVIEWRVNVYGTADLRTFQAWIGLNGEQDITYAYSGPQADPNGQDFLVGAENDAGDGAMSATLPTLNDLQNYRVTSTDPAPGASVSYTVRVRGTQQGAGVVRTELDSVDLPGTTIVDTTVQISRPRGNAAA